MIRDLKPYPVYRESGLPWLGDIPEGWFTKRAKNFFCEVDERSQSGQEELLSVSHKTGVTPRSQKNITMFMAESYIGHKLCRAGDIVINTMWAWMAALGVSRQTGIVSPAYGVYRLKSDDPFEPQFLDHLLRTQAYASEYLCRSTGVNASRLRLYPDKFLEIPILCPPRDEQITILRFIDHADRRIRRALRAKRKLVALINEQKQLTIHQAVTRGVDPSVRLKASGVEWLGQVPESWEVWKVGHFARIGNGSTPSRGNLGYWSSGTYPWLNSACVNQSSVMGANQFVTNTALKECHLPRVPVGSVLIAITGQGKTRGTSAVLRIEATINQHLVYITPRPSIISSDFLHLALTAAYPELRRISDDAGSTKGALTCQDISNFKIALPSLEEQKALVEYISESVSKADQTIELTKKEIDLLQELRAGLISDLVTGKIDVRLAAAQLPEEEGAVGADEDVATLLEDDEFIEDADSEEIEV